MHTIVSLDPGVTTGICIGKYEDGKLTLEIDQIALDYARLWDFLHAAWQKNFVIVYEKFEFRNAVPTGVNLIPARLIGVIELFCEIENVPVYPQEPSVQGDRAYWTNDKLKEYGVYSVGKEHGRSATKHLLYWWQFRAGFNIHQQADFRNYGVING